MKVKYSRGDSIAIVAWTYAMALFWGVMVFRLASARMGEVWALFVADVVATVFVWLQGLLYENVSVYDPYWSVAPPVMFTAWALYKGCWTLQVVMLLVAVWYWGVRLTWLGFVMCVASATIQIVADTQSHRFGRRIRVRFAMWGCGSTEGIPTTLAKCRCGGACG